LQKVNCDVLVSTDVLEHVHDPLEALVQMVRAVKVGGHMIIANCFYPVIACHLPSTFHFRYSFEQFCAELGLEFLGPCDGSHAFVYRRDRIVELDWTRLRRLERRSQILFFWHEWYTHHVRPWQYRFRRLAQEPMHYPRRLAQKIR
jgi:SAM-dependent methyltransferase